jgi:hypothetical protein
MPKPYDTRDHMVEALMAELHEIDARAQAVAQFLELKIMPLILIHCFNMRELAYATQSN